MNSWFRWYHGAVSDDKWKLIARKSRQPQAFIVAVWALLLEIASQAKDRGSVEDFDGETADALLDMPDGAAQAIYEALCSGSSPRIVNNKIASWEKRQPLREDSSAERTRAYRERIKAAKRNETTSDESVTQSDALVTQGDDSETTSDESVTPRIDKNRIDNNTPLYPPTGEDAASSTEKKSRRREDTHPYGENQNVYLTEAEYNRLCDKKGKELTDEAIHILDLHIGATGRKYKDHNLALQKWAFDEAVKKRAERRRLEYSSSCCEISEWDSKPLVLRQACPRN